MNIKDLRNLDKEQLLGLMGLKEKSTMSALLGSLGWVGIGLLAGAVTALLLAPKTGSDFRRTVGRTFRRKADDIMNTTRTKIEDLESEKGI